MTSRQSKTSTAEKPKKGPIGVQKSAPRSGIRRKSVSQQPDSASKTGTETDDSRDSPRQDVSKSSTDIKSPTGTPPPDPNARVYARTSNNEPSAIKVSFLKDKTPTSDQITSPKRLSPISAADSEEVEVQLPKVVIPTFRKGTASTSSNASKTPIRVFKNKTADDAGEKNVPVAANNPPPEAKTNLPIETKKSMPLEIKKNLPNEAKKILPNETKKNLLMETKRSLITDAKNVKVEAKKSQPVGTRKSIISKQTRNSMKDTKKPPIVIKKGSFSINVNNSEPRNRIKFSSNDPRVGLNNSSDRNNNQVNDDEDEGESAAPEEAAVEASQAAEGAEEEEPPAEEATETSPGEPAEAEAAEAAEPAEAGGDQEAEKSEAPEGDEVVEPEIEKATGEAVEGSVRVDETESKSKGSDKSKTSAGGLEAVAAGDDVKKASDTKSSRRASSQRAPQKNFINLMDGIEVYELCPEGNYIKLKNTSGDVMNFQNLLVIQKYEDSPYAVFKFPIEDVEVGADLMVTIWASGAPDKKDNSPTDFIFEGQKSWAGDIDKVKIIVSELEEGIFQYLTSPKIVPIAQVTKVEGQDMKFGKDESKETVGAKEGKEGVEGKASKESKESKDKKGSKGLGPCGGMMGGDGKVTCESVDSMTFGDKASQGRPTPHGDEKTKTFSPKKSRICELRTFDLSTICDDFDTRDKDGLTNCILCSCLVKKPVRHLEIMCEDDDDGTDNAAKVTNYSSEGPSDNDDPCEKYCKMMKAKKRDEHEQLLDETASNRSVEAWGKPKVDFGKGKNDEKKQTKEHDEGSRHRLDDNFCKEFGCPRKDTGGESENEKEGNAKEEDGGDAGGGNNFDKFNKFMKDICNEFNMDFSKDKSGKKSGDSKKSGGNRGLAADNSCSVICKRNGANGRKQGDEGESGGKFSVPVQDNQVIKDLCDSIKGFNKTNGEKVDKSDDLQKGKKNGKNRKGNNDDDSCRGMCSRKGRGNDDADDSGSDYHTSNQKKFTKTRSNHDNGSCSKICSKRGNGSDSDQGNGRKGYDSDDSYGGGYKNGKQRGSYQKDSCSNLCGKGNGKNGSDSHERNGTRGQGRSSGNNCDELCHGGKKSGGSLTDDEFYKEFCESLEKEKGGEEDCSKFYFCGSCNKNFSNCDPLTQEEIQEMEKKKKQDEDDALVRRCCKMDASDFNKRMRRLKDDDCLTKSNDSECEDPLLEQIGKLLAEGNFSCEEDKWEYQETSQVLKTADQLCKETLPKEELDCTSACKDTFLENKYKLGMAFFGEKEQECCESNLCELLGKLKQFRELRDVDVSESEESESEDCPKSNSPVSTNPMFDLDAFMSDNFDECLEGNQKEVKKPPKKNSDYKNKNKNHCNGQHDIDIEEELDADDYEHPSASRWMWNSLKSFYI